VTAAGLLFDELAHHVVGTAHDAFRLSLPRHRGSPRSRARRRPRSPGALEAGADQQVDHALFEGGDAADLRRDASSISMCLLSLWMSIRQPVSWAARRTFWPRRPIAFASWSSGTMSSIVWCASSMYTRATWAGAIAYTMNRPDPGGTG
jgi:hypothetical protein